jgi:mRNA interferase YafQ
MKKMYEVLDMLINGIEIPETFRPHQLQGQYKGCMECHIEEDFLLIWFDDENEIIKILRLGSHSELF